MVLDKRICGRFTIRALKKLEAHVRAFFGAFTGIGKYISHFHDVSIARTYAKTYLHAHQENELMLRAYKTLISKPHYRLYLAVSLGIYFKRAIFPYGS